jgi:hypothetical protein
MVVAGHDGSGPTATDVQDVLAGGVGYVKLGAGQVQIPNVWMAQVVDLKGEENEGYSL